MARAQDTADAARATLQAAASQTDDGQLTAGMYRIAVDTAGFVEGTLLPMLRGDQLELPLNGYSPSAVVISDLLQIEVDPLGSPSLPRSDR